MQAVQIMALADDGLITEDAVVLAQRDKTYRLFRLKKGRRLNFDKVAFYPDGALGRPYGSRFEVEKKQLVPITVDRGTKLGRKFKGDLTFAPDNRGVFDDGEAQGLTEVDIVEMKGQGVKGQAIVETMIEHSTSFKDKTKYSQEKYIKKKEKKHSPVIRIIKPSTRLLCAMYRDIAPAKICYLREDSLAQILTLSNVHAHSNVIVMETCQGFLVGAMLERMGGYGNLVQVFFGDSPVRNILDNFGHLSEHDLSILKMYPLHRVGELLSLEESSTSSVLTEALAGLRKEGQLREEDEVVKEEVVETSVLAGEMCSQEPELKRLKLDTKTDEMSTTSTLDPTPGSTSKKDTSSPDDLCNYNKLSTNSQSTMELDQDMGFEPVIPKLEGSNSKSNDDGIVIDKSVAVEDGDATHVTKCVGKHDTLTNKLLGNQNFEDPYFEPKVVEDKHGKRLRKEEAYKTAAQLLSQRKMDGLVIASRFHPEPILMSLIHLLSPSRPIVVYYHILEPLVQCYRSLKESGGTFNIQISETWMRQYQVLEERTHPLMNMSGQSGYLLTATTVKQSS